VNIST